MPVPLYMCLKVYRMGVANALPLGFAIPAP